MGSFGSTGSSKSIPVGFAAVVAASVAAAVAWRVLTKNVILINVTPCLVPSMLNIYAIVLHILKMDVVKLLLLFEN